jgi:hypothetical protein
MPHIIVKLYPGRSDEQNAQLTEAIVKDVTSILHAGDESVSKLVSKYAFTLAIILIMFMAFTRQVIAQIEKEDSNTAEVKIRMKIRVTANSKITVFELNNSQAASDLYAQLPLSIKVENYSDSEKIFYPPKKLDITNTPQANAKAGTLAYYAPWGDVVMFYGDFGSAAGLYELGHAVSGSEHINEMTGTLQIEKDPGL